MKNIQSVEHVWSVICSRSSVDSDTNNLSLFNLIEKVSFPVRKSELKEMKEKKISEAIFPMEFEIVNRFRKITHTKTTAFDLKITVVDSKNKILPLKIERNVVLAEGIGNVRIRNKCNGFPLREAGDYSIIIEAKDIGESEFINVGRIPVEVVINEIEE